MNKEIVRSKLLECETLIPNDLIIKPLKWKTLCFSVLTGENILITGPTGSGKTLTITKLKEVFPDRDVVIIPMGNTQDPKSALLGNVHLIETEQSQIKTEFFESDFIKAIQKENSIIVLEELTRADKGAWNILMSVLDPKQRFLKIGEKQISQTIKVANGVSFISTANIGMEYTSTYQLDAAVKGRFTEIKMDVLNSEQEIQLAKLLFPNLNPKQIELIIDLAEYTRQNYFDLNQTMTQYITTKQLHRFLNKLDYGFTFDEALEVEIYDSFMDIEDVNKMKMKMECYEE